MKRLFALALLCLLWVQSQAQNVKFYLYIMDASQIVGYTNGVPQFTDQDINDIFDDYTVTQFNKAFPLSNYEYLQKVYVVHCDSIGLAEELVAQDNQLFPRYEAVPQHEVLGYTPNDLNINSDDYLDLINAVDAWGNTKGDSNIILGVTDTYFDINHPDMGNQYALVGQNTFPSANHAHGTLVAGLMAGRTDNSAGFPSIGFRCKLHASNDWADDSAVYVMSIVNKRKVINGSWLTHVDTALNIFGDSIRFTEQGIYNEMYENGTLMVCGAGNNRSSPEKNPRNFLFPASFDHNISVSGVGFEGNLPGDTFNVKHVHEIYIGDTNANGRVYQHNSRVDICAPAVRVGGHFYDPGQPTVHYDNSFGWGTSFAAPLVSGAAGLLLSMMPWLSPYHLEYILKKSSFNHYSLAPNVKYAGATRWTGRIGAGTLDAGAATTMLATDDFFADYPDARTFIIKGIRLNSRCVPGIYPGVPNPQLDVIMENGTAPYTYRWDAIPGNDVVITNTSGTGVSAISTTITGLRPGATAPFIFNYRLTVYDATDIQKVANMVVRVELTADSIWDLAMQDAEADLYNEPNNMTQINRKNWDLWSSPDLWNRQTADDSLHHENPEYFNTNPNFLYTRIKNIGCIPSPFDPDEVQLWSYWTIASTGETWPADWIGSTFLNSHIAGGIITPGGIAIPALNPGQDTILEYSWNPPQPQLYDTLPSIDVCVLARIQTQSTPNFGMTIIEDSMTKDNVRNNNNIITRNLVVNNLNTANKPGHTNGVIIANGNITPTIFTIQIATDKHLNPYYSGHIASYLEMKLELGDLYDEWVAGGREGNVTSYDDNTKTILYDLEEPLRLENITLDAKERFWVHLTFTLKDGISVPYEIRNQRIHLRQLTQETENVDNGDGTTIPVERDIVYGNVSYSINIDEGGAAKPGRPAEIAETQESNLFKVYPNPVKNILTVEVIGNSIEARQIYIVDVSGKTVYEDREAALTGIYEVSTARLMPGVYFVKITDSKGSSYAKRFVKVE